MQGQEDTKEMRKDALEREQLPILSTDRRGAGDLRGSPECQGRNRHLFGKEYHASDYVFTWLDGRPYSPDYVTDKFSDLLKKHGLPHIRFHDLRHSCASLLLNSGFGLKDVQEWLGHYDIKMTANIYGHLDIGRKQSIADQLSGSLGAL